MLQKVSSSFGIVEFRDFRLVWLGVYSAIVEHLLIPGRGGRKGRESE